MIILLAYAKHLQRGGGSWTKELVDAVYSYSDFVDPQGLTRNTLRFERSLASSNYMSSRSAPSASNSIPFSTSAWKLSSKASARTGGATLLDGAH